MHGLNAVPILMGSRVDCLAVVGVGERAALSLHIRSELQEEINPYAAAPG